jgi:hypothetical protein
MRINLELQKGVACVRLHEPGLILSDTLLNWRLNWSDIRVKVVSEVLPRNEKASGPEGPSEEARR